MSEVRETSWNTAESHVLKHFTLELCKMIYKSHLIIMDALHILGKVCVARLAGPSETPQNSTNSWSRFAKEFGSRLNWQTGKYTTSQNRSCFLSDVDTMLYHVMEWNVMECQHVMPMSCLMSVKFKSIRKYVEKCRNILNILKYRI